MWDRLISMNPNLIRFYNGDNEELIKKALDNGYIINEGDLKKNKHLRKSKNLMRKSILIDPNYIKYYEGFNDEIIDAAVDGGYIPNIEDLKKNRYLGYSSGLIKNLIENGYPETIKYCKEGNEELIEKALNKGYIINEEDLKLNNYLASSDILMSKAILIDPNYIKCYEGKNIELIDAAIDKGYEPNIKDLQNNIYIRFSDKLISYLIENGYSDAIKYYRGNNEEIIKLALNKYTPNKKDLLGMNSLSNSSIVMETLLKKD